MCCIFFPYFLCSSPSFSSSDTHTPCLHRELSVSSTFSNSSVCSICMYIYTGCVQVQRPASFQTARPNPCFGISRLILECLDSKKPNEMWFLQIRSKPHLATHNDYIKIQSDGSASERLSRINVATLAERYGRQHRKQQSVDRRWNKLSISHAFTLENCFTSVIYLLMPMLSPRQPMQIGWWCLDTQIRSDHLQVTVWTVCLKDLIIETNQANKTKPVCVVMCVNWGKIYLKPKNKLWVTYRVV